MSSIKNIPRKSAKKVIDLMSSKDVISLYACDLHDELHYMTRLNTYLEIAKLMHWFDIADKVRGPINWAQSKGNPCIPGVDQAHEACEDLSDKQT